jgi:hypothetical protein
MPEMPPACRAAGATSLTAAAWRELVAGAPTPLRVAGDCMTPGIPDGAVVALEPARRVLPGDVVAFLAGNGRITVHRALASLPRRGRGWLVYTQADRAGRPDSTVSRSAVVGRVAAVEGMPAWRVGTLDRLRALWKLLAWGALRLTGPARGAT